MWWTSMVNWGFSLGRNTHGRITNTLQTFHLTFSLRISTGGPISKAITLPPGKTSARLRLVSPGLGRITEKYKIYRVSRSSYFYLSVLQCLQNYSLETLEYNEKSIKITNVTMLLISPKYIHLVLDVNLWIFETTLYCRNCLQCRDLSIWPALFPEASPQFSIFHLPASFHPS